MRVCFLQQDKIAERQLDAAAAPLPVTAAYCTYMQSLQTQPYAVLAAAFFAIEYVYNKVRGPRMTDATCACEAQWLHDGMTINEMCWRDDHLLDVVWPCNMPGSGRRGRV